MNLKKSILSIILLLVTTISFANDSTYVFPLNPDMPEWTTLPVEVKYQMFQIPEAELSVISTEKLVSAYLNYPVIGVILAYNNLNDGFKRVYNDFNGLRELVKRADGPQVIINRYNRMNASTNRENYGGANVGYYVFEFIYLEILLSQPEILEKLDAKDIKTLLSELIVRFDEKQLNIETHTMWGVESCAYLIANILDFMSELPNTEEDTNKSMIHLLKSGRLADKNTLNIVLQTAEAFCNKNNNTAK